MEQFLPFHFHENSKIDHYDAMQYFEVTFKEDFGPFKKGEHVNSVVVDFYEKRIREVNSKYETGRSCTVKMVPDYNCIICHCECEARNTAGLEIWLKNKDGVNGPAHVGCLRKQSGNDEALMAFLEKAHESKWFYLKGYKNDATPNVSVQVST